MDWRQESFHDPEQAREFLSTLDIKPSEASQALTALCKMQRERVQELELELLRAKKFDDPDGVTQAERQVKQNTRRFRILSALRMLAVQADAESFAEEFAAHFSGSNEDTQTKPAKPE